MDAMISGHGATFDQQEMVVKGHLGANTGYHVKISKKYLLPHQAHYVLESWS